MKYKTIILAILCLAIAAAMTACHKNADPEPDPGSDTISVTGVNIDPQTLTLVEGETGTLFATVIPENASNKKIAWSSSATTVATVSSDGIVTAVAPGESLITVKTDDSGKTATCIVAVTKKPILVSEIYFEQKDVTLYIDQNPITLVAVVLPEDATDKSLIWSSSVPGVATVSAEGVVTPVSAGETDITAKAKDAGGVSSRECHIIVLPMPEGAVDLGIGVFWGTCNLGADNPEDSGDYYSWGEVSTKSEYTWANYVFEKGTDAAGPFSKYVSDSSFGTLDRKTVLEDTDDVVRTKLGGKWRMPTRSEMEDLINECTWDWRTVNGVDGYRISGKKKGYTNNRIFIPAAGQRNGSSLVHNKKYGYYWTSSLNSISPSGAHSLYFYSTDRSFNSNDRYLGFPIRPVSD